MRIFPDTGVFELSKITYMPVVFGMKEIWKNAPAADLPEALRVGPQVSGREVRFHFSDDLTGKEYVEAVSDKVLEMKINRPEASRGGYQVSPEKAGKMFDGIGKAMSDHLEPLPPGRVEYIPPFMNFAGLEPCGYRNKKTGEMWPFGHVMIQQHDRYKDNPDLEPVYRYKDGSDD